MFSNALKQLRKSELGAEPEVNQEPPYSVTQHKFVLILDDLSCKFIQAPEQRFSFITHFKRLLRVFL